MKVKLSKIVRIGIILAILIDICFGYLFSFDGILFFLIQRDQKKGLAIISIILCALCLNTRVIKQITKQDKFLCKYCFFIILCFVIQVFHSWLLYPNQGIFQSALLASVLLIVLLVFPLLYVFSCDSCIEKMLENVNSIIIIWYILAIIQSLLYNMNGTIICHYLFDMGYARERYGNLRFTLDSLGNLMVIYNAYMVIKKNSLKKLRIKSLIGLALGLYSVFFIQMTRMYEVSILVSILFIFYFKDKKISKKMARGVSIVILLAFVIGSDSFWDFIYSFSLSGIFGGSTLERFNAYQYYWQCIIKSPILGFGYPHEGLYSTIEHGTTGMFYLSDTGIVGAFAQLGIFSIPLYVAFLVRFFFIIKNCNLRGSKYTPLLIGIFVFLIIQSTTMSILIPMFIITVPVVLAILEFIDYRKL